MALSYLLCLCFFANIVIGKPIFDLISNATLLSRASSREGNLRILPIGDSITVGFGSKDGNGYRLYLRNDILSKGAFNIDFIGTQVSGDNNDDNQ